MKAPLYLLTLIALCLSSYTCDSNNDNAKQADSIIKIEMQLSAYGVESDDFPTIDVYIDFKKDSSNCNKWYFHPDYPPSTYTLSKDEMQSILKLLKISDLEKIKKEYRTDKTDQPTATTVIYTTKGTFKFKDYGLVGEYPLQELYDIVYKY